MRLFKLGLIGLVVGFVAAACSGTAPTSTSPASAAVQTTSAPGQAAVEQSITVFAAASLTAALTEIGEQFQQQNPGVRVDFNFAASQQLRIQLEQGAVADVFASANTQEMKRAIQAGLVVSGTQTTFVRNRLTVIVPQDNPGDITELKDLARPGLKLVLAAANVPIGSYALASLDKMNADFGATFSQTVLSSVVSYEDNVKQVVAKVQLGEADAGIVYVSDVTPQVVARLIKLDIPDKYNILATYPIATLKFAPQTDLAAKFVDYVLSAEGQAILQKWGFIPRAAASSSTAPTPLTSNTAPIKFADFDFRSF
ncbi:Molybdate-binding protein ModA [Thermoflexales bacterium]|nr:Molybdate-binding protein ModA [Thermoflexales bacterium]